ncbi:hypothetical protein CYD30_20845 [Kosakonia cowanii]|nr:hypothetical protein CYD30_20845 [Kosakonia cowanii]
MSVKNGFDSLDIAQITQRVSEAKPYRLKKADYLEIGQSLAIGSVEVVKGAICVTAVATIYAASSTKPDKFNSDEFYDEWFNDPQNRFRDEY